MEKEARRARDKKEQRRAYKHKWYKEHLERHRAYRRKWYKKNAKRYCAKKREWYHAYGHKDAKKYYRKNAKRVRIVALQRFFNLDKRQAEKAVMARRRSCHLCGVLPKRGKSLCIDHDHNFDAPLAVRGILCWRCNFILSLIENEPNLQSTKVQAYLRTAQRNRKAGLLAKFLR